MKKERIDVLLVQQGLFETREQAKRAVMAGEILGENEERLDKPGMKVDPGKRSFILRALKCRTSVEAD